MTKKHYEIVKDTEYDNLFYVVSQEKYDEDDERTIIGFGETENEALKDALHNAIRAAENCVEQIEEVVGKFTREYCLEDDFYLKSRYVPRPSTFDGHTIDSFSALCFDKEDKKWYKFYR